MTFDGAFVSIHRAGFLARATAGKGDKRFPIANIAAVQWKPAGFLMNGFISLTLAGASESTARFGERTMGAAEDPNAVIFTKRQQARFEELRTEVERAIATRQRVTE